jgi:Flp pilus assembly protein TadD
MRPHRLRSLLLILLLDMSISLRLARAQPNLDTSDQAERQKAEALFNRGNRLEALPLLEDLVRKNPNDDAMLVALAAALVDHAVTLIDQYAAAKERLHARDLLQKAWELGNTSPFEENLRQLLDESPANGAIKFSDNSAVEKAMVAGESAFYTSDFNDALKAYAKALELEPANYSATLFTANAYDRENDVAKAGQWYEQAIRLNPNTETAYRYYADMLAKEGDMSKARTMLIKAAVAEPYNKIVWREIRAWAIINYTAFNIVYVSIPIQAKNDPSPGARQSREVLHAWQAYYSVREEWQKSGRFRARFPKESEYRHSLPEESEALTAAAKVFEKLKQNKKSRGPVTDDSAAGLLLRLYEAGLIDPYVLFSLGDDGIAMDYIAYRQDHRVKLVDYMDKFVLPPAPAKR